MPAVQQAEIWLSDHETEGDSKHQLRNWSQKLCLTYSDELGPIDLSKVVFFRVIGNRDAKKKGMTYRLMPPHNHLIRASAQLMQYAFEGFGDITEQMKTVNYALGKVEPSFVIAIYDDHHFSDADRLYTLLHELYHIDSSMIKMRTHTVQDHFWMLERYGLGKTQDLTEFESLLKSQ
jgi:hypothetical protein